MSFGATIKEHPYASVGVLAIGCIVLYALMSGGGNNSAASADPTQDPAYLTAELQAGTQLAGMQLAAQSQDKQIASQENIANLAANVELNSKYSDNATALALANTNAGISSKQIDAEALLGAKQLDAQTVQTLAQLKQVTDVAGITSAVNLAGITANRDTSIAATTALSDAQKYTAQLGAQTEQLISNNSASVAKKQSDNGLFGSVLGTVGSLLAFL